MSEQDPPVGPSADHPHVRRGSGYFCPGDGYAYAETRADGAVDRCLGCGAPVTEGGDADNGR